MIGWHVVVGHESNVEGLTGVIVEKQPMGVGVEQVETVILAMRLVIGRRRVMSANFGPDKFFTQPMFTAALIWEREPPKKPCRFRITKRLRLYFRRSPARQDSWSKVP